MYNEYVCVCVENFAHFLPSLSLHAAILTFVYFSMMPSSPLHLHPSIPLSIMTPFWFFLPCLPRLLLLLVVVVVMVFNISLCKCVPFLRFSWLVFADSQQQNEWKTDNKINDKLTKHMSKWEWRSESKNYWDKNKEDPGYNGKVNKWSPIPYRERAGKRAII